ncbi:hypothetical protein MKW98_003127 [Papaver atlanticum]|uniref:Uncharacterized protein n=2 Tax=Papaver TaxID=3468 RepID=A0A4Y7KX44_PAPSO|nr:uncharacterized protein LOC113293020 isoform X1 [Papaver somniferum]XP_026418406.1 uncharacterized protein LOC113313832 [Papaver somniferum]KAI3936510.1 hypothetical protein MKW92_053023 [Papaver armeniacum]KAI3957406.1 hypothetical protein MKW98_003127 [Papaver atlanticum]RZC70443.1 hypothetical protein C5167_033586 [Papaver somniferum]RZC76940.1 hypothetical protein C5167_001120 [Papaver somniferum]
MGSVVLGGRRPLAIGLVIVMILGSAVYFKLWSIDYDFSSEDREYLRRQFDLANREAMDESAEWRLKYDQELQKSNVCAKELAEANENLRRKLKEAARINKKLSTLEQENVGLLDRVESLTQEIQTEKLKCSL